MTLWTAFLVFWTRGGLCWLRVSVVLVDVINVSLGPAVWLTKAVLNKTKETDFGERMFRMDA